MSQNEHGIAWPIALAGRRALVTGAGGGIGGATARFLAAAGASVAVLDARLAAAEAVASSIEDDGGEAIAIACDVGDQASVRAAAETAAHTIGGLDSVVAAAAISIPSSTTALTMELWDMVLRVNLTGVFLTVRETLPYLLEAGGGSIVTLGSMASFVAAGESSAYDASKGGVLQLTKSIAVEYSDRNIRANCVCPGRTTTGLGANSREITTLKSDEPKAPGSANAYIPMGRSADPTEIAGAVAFLCSEHASYITGTALPVDGGYLAV
jgi:NAD(P)-dependent dehydrogenase (short-subunit alcohol dehydrogenase family)